MSNNEFCKLIGQCGGCLSPHVPYKEQLLRKEEEIIKLLEKHSIDRSVYLGIAGSDEETGYRNKMEYTFGNEVKGGDLCLGLHKRGGFMSVITTDDCKLVTDDYNKIVAATLEFAKEKNYSFYHKKRHEGLLRHLVIRRGVRTNELLINIITSGQEEFDAPAFSNMILSLRLDDKIIGIVHSVNDRLADMVAADKMKVLYGKPFYEERIAGLSFEVGVFSFFQTNVNTAEKMYKYALSLATDLNNKIILDLYSGTGTISQIASKLTSQSSKITGVEIIKEAVLAAKKSSEENGLTNCEFIEADVLAYIDDLSFKPDIIILDPPRMGIHPKALHKILRAEANEIIYISCNPKTAIPDIAAAKDYGYETRSIKAFDQFPQTNHSEMVVLLSKPDVDSI